MNKTFLIFLEFLRRDFYVHLKQIRNYMITYLLIFPILFSFVEGYIMPNTIFDLSVLPSKSILLIGVIIYLMLGLAMTLNGFLLIDLENDKFTQYQTLLLNPELLILEKIIFSSAVSFVFITPFFIISKLILREEFNTACLSIPKLLIIFLLGTIFCSAYAILAMCKLKGTHQLGMFWRRFNMPLAMFGAEWVPWIVIFKFSKVLGYLALLNPFLYIGEGVRGAVIGINERNYYIPFIYCVIFLVLASIILTLVALKSFKKRIDHI